MEIYQNIELAPEERARDLLSQMSLAEKVGQMSCYMPQRPGQYRELEDSYPAGVGHVSALQMRALDTMSEAAQMQRDIQKIIMGKSPHHIPAIFHMEGLCGAYIPGAASFPSGLGRASGFDPELEEKVGRIVGRQERAAGITQTFAPVLDISRDSRMGRQGETYGEDPALAAALGSAYTQGIQSGETGGRRSDAVAKHFLGFHAGSAGIHGADTQISERELREVYGKPFQAAITQAGLKGVMPCYCSLNGEPVSASREILTGLLREEMGFEGMTVSDYGAVSNIHNVQRVGENLAWAGAKSLEAGMDAELPSPVCFTVEMAEGLSDEGMAALDRAVENVLTAKFRMGLFEYPYALDGEALEDAFYDGTEEAVMLQSARESLVLLKNDGTLPLTGEKKRIAVIGPQAATARIFFGGYTHLSMAEGLLAAVASMAGVKAENVELPKDMRTIPGTQIQCDDDPAFEALLRKLSPGTHSLLEELRARMPGAEIRYAKGYEIAGNSREGYEEALDIAGAADLVLVMLGGKHGTSSIASMGEGVDATDINLPQCQEDFLRELEKLHKPVVGVHFNGRPISSDGADRACNALVEAWNPARKGAQAIVDVLLGVVNPSGKMPVSTAYTAGQIPIYYNHPNGSSWHQGESIGFAGYVDCSHRPRYAFGHGLSYTTFSYTDLVCPEPGKDQSAPLEISLEVENVGDCGGTEILQLYIRDEYASCTRPERELAGFARVELGAGEKKKVRFLVAPGQLAFWTPDGRWKVEAGRYAVLAGASSEDIRLRGGFEIAEDFYVDGRTRGFYAGTEESRPVCAKRL